MMKIAVTEGRIPEIEADAVIVGVDDKGNLTKEALEVDQAIGGTIAALVERKEITGKLNELTVLLAPGGIRAGQVVVVGLGDRETFGCGQAYRVSAAAARRLAEKKRKRVAFCLGDGWTEGVCRGGDQRGAGRLPRPGPVPPRKEYVSVRRNPVE